jgi:DNA-binding GntR family transcriptional regulator
MLNTSGYETVTISDDQPASQTRNAYDAIKSAILRWELAPGEQVTELQLTTSFGYGRAAVRAALTRLSHERLVQAIPRQGYAIAPVTFKLVQDLFALRLIIERAAARIAAERADDAFVIELERLNDACLHRPGDDDMTALREANRQFHITLTSGSGNDLLIDTATTTLDGMQRILYLPLVANVWKTIDATYEDHSRIIDAVRARDPDAAEHAIATHIESNRDFFIGALISSPAFREIDLLRVR